MKVQDLNEKNVVSVYSGIDGKCCCGCSGVHYANPNVKQPDWASHRKPSISMIRKVIKILKNDSSTEKGKGYFSTVIGKRLYIAYYKE